jgi:hypothetical protein
MYCFAKGSSIGKSKAPRDPKEVIRLWIDYEIILMKLMGSFINQLKQIERIARFERPTKQILEALRNIFEDKQKERHFYINLKKVSWLKPLYKGGFFSPEYVLEDSLWNQAEYLEFISLEIKKSNLVEKNSEILIKIIYEICHYSNNVKKLENFRIWYFLLDILTNLPKDYVTDKIIDYLPSFFDTKYENNLQSESIFKFIYSFFDDKKAAIRNKTKIEKLVKLVFKISDNEKFKDHSTYETGKYFPVIRAYRLKRACENQIFYSAIPLYCSNEIIYHIASNLMQHLKAQYISEFWIKSIFHIKEVDKHSYSIETIYSIFLKNTCVELAKLNPSRLVEIIETFLSEKFNHKHFIKLSFFLLAKTWKHSKSIFFDLLKNNDERMVFSTTFWADDLYFLLEEVADNLNKNETKIIKQIIDNGSQNEKYYDKAKYLYDYKLLWYSALMTNPSFEMGYKKLSKKLDKTKKQVRPSVERNVTFGSKSPLSKKEIKNLSIKELVETLKIYDPERGFREPSVEGFASRLNESIKETPELFYDNYKLFLNVPYRHISEIYSALSDTWNKSVLIKWKNCLNFILAYINQPAFGKESLQLKNSSYKYDHLSVIRSFCRLLTSGTRSDEKAFSAELLPLAETIIFTFLNNYITTELPNSENGKLGSAMFAINSTTGVIIGALFDLSLRKARLLKKTGNKEKRWSDKEKLAYEDLIGNKVQEFYMYLGWHRNQFYYLDYDWTNKQLEAIPRKDNQTIKSYFGGHLITYPNSEVDYKIFKSIYLKAIKENWQVVDSTMGQNPLEIHATVFYIFDYEDLRKGEIITQILNQSDLKKTRSIIHSLSFKYDKYLEDLNIEDKVLFKSKIFKIWNYTLKKLEEIEEIEAKDMPTLFYLIKYIDELNNETHSLIMKTSKFARHGRDFDELIKNLNRLKLKSNVVQSSIYACEIFMESIFRDFYYASIMQKEIIEFVEFMYTKENTKLISYSNKICNEFAKNGQYFLRDLYEKYNS